MAKRISKKSAKIARKPSSTAAGTPHIIYHKDGSIWGRGSMLGGKMHAYWEFFRKDGSILRSGSFDREQQVGEWTTYDASGKPLKTTEMKPPAGSRRGAASGGGGKVATKAAAKKVAAKAAKPREAIANSAVRKSTKETTHATKS